MDNYYYDDGNWHASTLGHFVGLLVDAGQDPAVCFRVKQDSESDKDGEFTRLVEVLLLPDGYVGDGIMGCKTIHKTLVALLKANVIK